MSVKKVLLQKQVSGVLYDIYPKTDATISIYSKTVEGSTVDTTVAAELASLASDIAALPTTADLSALRTEIVGELADNETVPALFDTLKEIGDFLDQHDESIGALANLIADVGVASSTGVDATGLHAAIETLQADVEALQEANGTNVSKTKTGSPDAANGHLYLDGVDTTVYDDSALAAKVGDSTDAAAAAGTTAWSRIKNAEGDIDTLEGAVGAATDTANAAGTTAWSRIKNAEGDIDTLQAAVGAATDTAAADGTTVWSRVKALEEADGTNVSKTKAGSPDAANGHVYLDGVDTTIYDDSTLAAKVGDSTDAAAAAGTTAWSRIKNAENDIDTLESGLGTSADTANASGTTAWSRIKNAESDVDTLQAGLGTSSDTANAAGTTAWSRINALQAREDQVQYVTTSPATPAADVLYMVELA